MPKKVQKKNAAILRRFNHFMQTKTRELYSPVLSLLASSMPFAVADMIFKSVSLIVSSMVSSWRRRVDFSCSRSGKKNWSTDTSSKVTSSYKICKLGCCPLFSMDAIYRGAIFSVSANWWYSLCFSCCFNGLPESLKIEFFFILLHNYFTQLHFTVPLFFEIWLHIS